MKTFIARILSPFIDLAIHLDESRRTNEDGSWDKYWARKNCKAELRALKTEYKLHKKYIKTWWRIEK